MINKLFNIYTIDSFKTIPDAGGLIHDFVKVMALRAKKKKDPLLKWNNIEEVLTEILRKMWTLNQDYFITEIQDRLKIEQRLFFKKVFIKCYDYLPLKYFNKGEMKTLKFITQIHQKLTSFTYLHKKNAPIFGALF